MFLGGCKLRHAWHVVTLGVHLAFKNACKGNMWGMLGWGQHGRAGILVEIQGDSTVGGFIGVLIQDTAQIFNLGQKLIFKQTLSL